MKTRLTDEKYRYGSYTRGDFKPDILYGLVSFGGIEALFAAALQKYGFSYQGEPRLKKSHAVPESSRLVQTCLRVYEAYTGRPGACLAIGGGTYVHEIEGGVAFGVEHPGRDYRIHGADEYASVAEMIETAAMYADVIKALCYDE